MGYYDRFHLLFSSPGQRPCPLLPSPKQDYMVYYDRFQLLFSSPGQRPCPLLPSPKQHYMGYYDRFQLWDIDLIFGMWVYTDKLQIKFTFRSGPMIFGRVVDWNLTKYLVVITFFRYAWRYWLDFYTPTHRVVGILEYPCPSVPKPCVRNYSHLSFVGFYSYLVSWLAMIWACAYYSDFTNGWFLREL